VKQHTYKARVHWTGNDGEGTKTYRGYRRDHVITCEGKPAIAGSSDPSFRGDRSRFNPEELLVASLSACHMLWYLHLCAVGKVVVLEYEDQPSGTLEETADGGGCFLEVTLRPRITVTPESDLETAKPLHHDAHGKCFIANSVNFPVACEPVIRRAE